MSEQILSQEEIDALLSAMSKGEVDLEQDPRKAEPEIKSYDLTAQSVMLRNQFYALEEVNQKFAAQLQVILTEFLQRSIGVEMISSEMIKFGDFMKAFSTPTSFNFFSMDPLIGSAMLAIEPDLVFSLVDCMFGGDGKPLNQDRDFTPIERRMSGRFVDIVLQEMDKSWQVVYPISSTLKKIETKTEFIHLVEPEELVLILAFAINGEEFAGTIHFCISYLMLEPIKEKLSTRYLREKDQDDVWNAQLRHLLRDTLVTVSARLGHSAITVRDLLNLKSDDVLKLGNGPTDPITLNVELIPKFQAFPGIVKGNRAVEITTLIQ
jgi:flagellar motor switch protein FliM